MIKAIYGKVSFNSHLCPNCKNRLLNNSQWFICDVCGYSNKDDKAKKFKVIVPPPGIKKKPPRSLQKMLLEIQNNKCYWCSNEFDSIYWKNNKVKFLKIHWDHKNPFSFEQTNRGDNWVASCNICNLFKSNFMFKTDKECRNFILRRWQKEIDKGNISIEIIKDEA